MRPQRSIASRLQTGLMLLIVVLAGTLLPAAHAVAAPAAQESPAEQCARGIELFRAGKTDEAFPLLKAGVDGREGAAFASPVDLGVCATFLAMLYKQRNDVPSELAAWTITLETFQPTGLPDPVFYALLNIATSHQTLQQYLESQDYAQQALDVANQQGNPEWRGQALDLLRSNAEILGELDRALDYALQAQAAFAEAKNDSGVAQALAHTGSIYQEQGRTAAASEMLAEAYARAQRSSDVPVKFDVFSILSKVYQAQGKYDQALALQQEMLELVAAFPSTLQASAERSVLINRSTTLLLAGRNEESLADRRRLLELARGNPQTEIFVLIGMGQLYAHIGRTSDALDSYEQALSLAQANDLPVQESEALQSVASIYGTQGRDNEALELLQEAYQQLLPIQPSLDGMGKAILVSILNEIGAVYARQGQYIEALSFIDQALEQAEASGNKGMVAATLLSRGTTLSLLQRPDEALRDLERSLATPSVSNNVAVANQLIGDVMVDLNRLDEALNRFAVARAGYQATGFLEGQVFTLRKAARVYATQGRSDEALTASEEAMALLEELRAQAGDEEGRAGFTTRFADVYDQAAFLYHQQGDHTQAFLTVERGRARAFLDSLATGTVELSNEDARALFMREREAYGEQQAARDALARSRAQTEPDAALITDLEAQLERAEAVYADIQNQIAARGDQLAGLVSARKDAVLTLEQVQARLAPDTTLVSYLVGEETSLAFVVTDTELRTVELAVGRDTLTTQMAALHAFDGDQNDTSARLQPFYTQLIAPLELDAARSRLLIIPHGVLHYLPFAALTPDGLRYLGDAVTISILPAASVLRYFQEPVAPAPTLPNVMAMANPEGPPRIEGVAEAARTIGQLFATEPLLGEQATVANLTAADERAQVLHLGTHGSFNRIAPLESYLQLTPAGEDDGKLTVGEVYGLNLKQADLVVLSACETQVNQLANPNSPLAVTAGDELVGLQRAFFFAGAQNVVTTLWQVPDQPSRLLMERFYIHIRAGLAPADALQQAQQEVRAQYPNPRDWAGFVLSGVGATPLVEPLRWWQQVPWWAWALGGGGLIVAIAGGVLLWRRRAMLPPGEKLAKD